MMCFQITTTTPDTIRPHLDFVEHRIADFWTTTVAARWWCHLHPVSLDAQVAAIPLTQDWRRPYQQEQRDDLKRKREPTYQLDSYVGLWGHKTSAAIVADALPDALQVPKVEQVPFPQLVQGDYVPHSLYLEPVRKGDPYLTVLTAHALQGGWAPAPISVKAQSPDGDRVVHAENWHALLRLNIPLVLAIDVQRYGGASLCFDDSGNLPRTNEQRAAERALRHAMQTASAHAVRYAILVQAQKRSELEHRVEQVQQALGRRVHLERMRGTQERHIQFFQPVAPASIETPIHKHNTPAYWLAGHTPMACRRTPRHIGISLGTDLHEGVQVNVELSGADGRENGSGILAGEPGYGKSVLLNKVTLEHTVAGGQAVLIDPGEDAWRLRRAVNDAHACAYHTFNGTQALNILDPHEASAAEQYRHVLDTLRIALGRVETGVAHWTIVPRPMTRAEERAVRKALFQPGIYGSDGEHLATMTSADAPLLRELAPLLRDQGADDLADDIMGELVELAPNVWDRRTQLRFDPTKDMNLFHVRDVPRAILPLWYKKIFDEVTRYAIRRQDRRPLLIVCDEWWIASMLDTMRVRGIAAVKDLRKYGVAFLFADQHAQVVYSGDRTLPDLAGAVRHHFFFRLKENGVKVIKDAHGDQLPAKLADQIPNLKRGQMVAMVDGEARLIDVTLRDRQKAALVHATLGQ